MFLGTNIKFIHVFFGYPVRVKGHMENRLMLLIKVKGQLMDYVPDGG